MNTSRESSIPNRRHMLPRLGIVPMACFLCASMVLLSAQTQPAPEPFTKDKVLELLTGGVAAKRVEALVREHGIDFQITPETESELRKAGASEPLLIALRALAPKPTLVVTTTPGGAQVFVDDELIARTSAEGRLKISTLAAGPHKLRLSLDGYRDHAERIDLASGTTLTVSAVLELDTHTLPPATPSYPPTITDTSSPPERATANRVTFPGSLGVAFGSLIGPNYPGTIMVGNGMLRFSAKDPFAKYSFEVPLSDVTLRSQYKSGVEFDVQFPNKKQHLGFWVVLGKHRAADEIQASKSLYEALKAESK